MVLVKNVFILFVVVLMFFSLVGFLIGGDNVNISFQSVLNMFSRAPVVSTDWVSDLTEIDIGGDWGAFEFLKEFIEVLVRIVGVVGYVFTGLAQALVFVAYLVGNVFVPGFV